MIDYSEYAAARLGVLLLFCVFPFVLRNGYFGMTALRFHFFCLVSASVFFLLFLHRILISRRPFPPVSETLRAKPFYLVFFAFIFCMFLSAALSVDRELSFFGDKSRYLGVLFFVAVLFSTLWISCSYVFTEKDLLLFQLAACCACLVAILQYQGLDLFDLRKVLRDDQRPDFLSPLGNIGVFSEYVCLLVPPAMYLFCFSGGRRKRLFYFAVSCVGFLGVLCADCDAGYLGFGAAVFVLFLLVCRKNGSVAGVFILIFGFAATAAGFGMLRRSVPDASDVSALTALISDTVCPYAVLLVCVCCIVFLQRRPPSEKARRRMFSGALVLAAAGIVAVPALMWYYTAKNPAGELGGFEKYLRLNEDWGSHRGFIWSRCLMLFRDAPLYRKVFGFGEETVGVLFLGAFRSDMEALGFLTNNAHNIYLQFLLTSGIAGLGAYLVLFVSAVLSALKKDRPLYVQALALSLAAFAAESFVTITQPISTPFLFLLFAVIAAGSDPAKIPDIRFLFHAPAAENAPQPTDIIINTEKDV